MGALGYTMIPVAAAGAGAAVAVWKRPGATVTSAVQHFAAGVVFAAAAAEILPDVMHGRAPLATLIGGALGVIVMLAIKRLEDSAKGPVGMLAAVAVDIFIDGLVLGLAFVAGAKAGLLLTVALTLEVLFLGLTLTEGLSGILKGGLKIVLATVAIALLLPLGALAATPVSMLAPTVVTGFLSFGLMALLYLVTEELLVEAHEKPDNVWISSTFFIGFLALLLLEELMS